MTDVEVAVIGAGLMGAATAWAVSRRGHSVALLEARRIGHDRGSSHGSARIFRRAYPDPMFVAMTGRARELWSELEHQAQTSLLRITGGIDHGAARDTQELAQALHRCGVTATLLDPAQARERWPDMVFDGPVLFHPDAGVLDAAATVTSAVRLARAAGASVYENTPVLSLEAHYKGVRLHTEQSTVHARSVVVAAGAWLAPLLGETVPLPRLTVSQQQVFHFPRRDVSREWPIVVHKDALQIYGLPGGRDGGPDGAIKLGEHDGGVTTTADTRDGVVDPRARKRMVRYVQQWLPGLEPTPFAEATCLYTTTDNDDFILDRVGRIVVCSPCSGQGAKFTPLIGEMSADLALGTARAHPRFGLARRAAWLSCTP
jgi:monomeric sarcosine oxidase